MPRQGYSMPKNSIFDLIREKKITRDAGIVYWYIVSHSEDFPMSIYKIDVDLFSGNKNYGIIRKHLESLSKALDREEFGEVSEKIKKLIEKPRKQKLSKERKSTENALPKVKVVHLGEQNEVEAVIKRVSEIEKESKKIKAIPKKGRGSGIKTKITGKDQKEIEKRKEEVKDEIIEYIKASPKRLDLVKNCFKGDRAYLFEGIDFYLRKAYSNGYAYVSWGEAFVSAIQEGWVQKKCIGFKGEKEYSPTFYEKTVVAKKIDEENNVAEALERVRRRSKV